MRSSLPFYPLIRAALAPSDPAPVERLLRDIPTRHLTLVTAQRPSGTARVRAPHANRPTTASHPPPDPHPPHPAAAPARTSDAVHPEKPREHRIAPRYLANSDADVSPAIRRLLDVGWALSRDELANTFVVTPDLRARLAFLPEGEDSTLWKISAGPDAFAPPERLVTFDHCTPPEVVTD